MDTGSVEAHFAAKDPNVQAVYNRLLAELRKIGPVKESPKQTSIHLDNANGFAGVNTRKSYLLLNFRTDYKIDNPRITKLEQHSARRFMHTVRLAQESEVDAELLKWLKDAYLLAG
jgi:uncharacterized protein DUF5655